MKLVLPLFACTMEERRAIAAAHQRLRAVAARMAAGIPGLDPAPLVVTNVAGAASGRHARYLARDLDPLQAITTDPLPPGAASALEELARLDLLGSDEPAVIINWRDIPPVDILERMAASAMAGQIPAVEVAEPGDHPIQLFTHYAVAHADTLAPLDPEATRAWTESPEAAQAARLLRARPADLALTVAVDHPRDSSGLDGLPAGLFARTVKTDPLLGSWLQPASDLENSHPAGAAFSALYLGVEPGRARRVVRLPGSHGAAPAGVGFFAPEGEAITATHEADDPAGLLLHLPDCLPADGRFLIRLQTSTVIVDVASLPGGPRRAPVRIRRSDAVAPCTLMILRPTDEPRFDIEEPMTLADDLWVVDPRTGAAVNPCTCDTVCGRQDFPLLMEPTGRIGALTPAQAHRLDDLLCEGAVSGLCAADEPLPQAVHA
jgi:hypothetical protein